MRALICAPIPTIAALACACTGRTGIFAHALPQPTSRK